LRVLAAVVAVPGGRALVGVLLGRFRRPEGVRVGAVVPVRHARDALRVLPLLGASVVEVSPVDDASDLVVVDDPRVEAAASAAVPGVTVLATTDVLVAAGPAWFRRVLEAATPTVAPQRWRDVRRDPRRWPSWVWDLSHLAPVYVGVVLTAIALILSRPYLCDTDA
jgi:hypothetical protein